MKDAGRGLQDFRVEHQEAVRTPDGTYRIDVTARFTQLGVNFLVIVECKDHARPVGREDVQVLADKVRAGGAQKGILFSTNGFQKGAVEYARAHGIALVRILEGVLTYDVRGRGMTRPPVLPSWLNIPAYVGQLISAKDDGSAWSVSVIERQRVAALTEFLESA